MKTGRRNTFDNEYPIRKQDFEIIEAEVDKLWERVEGLANTLVEVKANTNNLKAHTDFENAPIHGEANEKIIKVLNALRDIRTGLVPLEEEARQARRNARRANSIEMKKGK